MDEEIQRSIDEFENRKIYESLDPETLRSIPDDELEQAIVDYIWLKRRDLYVEDRDGYDEHAAFATLAPGLPAFWHTWVVYNEVYNGGFNQYYWNSRDRYNADAVEAFEFFGAIQHADLMRRANAARAQEAEIIGKYQDKNTLEAFSESYEVSQLDELDREFYDLKEDLSALRIAKIREKPEWFTGD